MADLETDKTATKPTRVRVVRHRRGRVISPLLDTTVALVCVLSVGLMLGAGPTRATPPVTAYQPQFAMATGPAEPAIAEAGERPLVEIATTASPMSADAVYKRTSAWAAWLLLSLALSLAIGFNAAVIRHVRRVYARPRVRRKD